MGLVEHIETDASVSSLTHRQLILLWAIALLFYWVGDTGTTLISIHLGGYETNPITVTFLETAGLVGLFLQKLLIVGPCLFVWIYWPDPFDVGPDPYRHVVPLVLVATGIYLTSHNLATIAELLG